MSLAEEKVVNQLQDLLELWRVTYNVEQEKYIAKTKSIIILDAEQLERIRHLGLSIFTIRMYEKTLTIKFSSESQSF